MGIFTLSTSYLFLILSFILIDKKEKIFSPTKLFFILWTFILTLSNIHITNLYKPSNKAYFLIFLMLVFYFFGSFVSQVIISKKKKDKNDVNKKNIALNLPIFFLLISMTIFFSIIDGIIILKQRINGVPMWQLRNWTLEPYGSDNPILSRRSFLEDIIRALIISPFQTLIYPIAIYYLFNVKEKKYKISVLILTIISLFTTSISGAGSRLTFVYFMMTLTLGFIYYLKNSENQNKINKKKYLFPFIITIIIGILTISLITVIRVGVGSIKIQIYKYFAIPPTLLSLWLPQIENSPKTHGLLSFFGIHSYIFRIFKTLGLNFLVPSLYNETYQHMLDAEKFLDVGIGKANAFVTPIYYFIIDGGVPFVCLASFLFGIVIEFQYNKIENEMNIRNFLFYILIMYGVLVSFMRIQTAIPSYIISFIFSALLTFDFSKFKNREKSRRKKENKIISY